MLFEIDKTLPRKLRLGAGTSNETGCAAPATSCGAKCSKVRWMYGRRQISTGSELRLETTKRHLSSLSLSVVCKVCLMTYNPQMMDLLLEVGTKIATHFLPLAVVDACVDVLLVLVCFCAWLVILLWGVLTCQASARLPEITT